MYEYIQGRLAEKNPAYAVVDVNGIGYLLNISIHTYSQLIEGDLLQNIFDGSRDSLARGVEANPFVLEFTFPAPRSVSGISADFGSMDLTMSVLLYAPGSDTPVRLSQGYQNQPPDPHVEMKFDNPPAQVSKMRVEIFNLLAGQTANIHIREFKLLP